MKRLFLLLFAITFSIIGFAQNTSPLVVRDFMLLTNGILDIEQVPKDARTDWDSNPVCMIQVKAVGFDENLMQKFIFVPNGLDIMYKTTRKGMVILYVSSNKMGEITIKHMGDCLFKLPHKLEGHKIYVLTLGMETATLVIRTVPAEAEIYVDNQRVGKGESITAVSIGAEHRYRVVCEDYWSKEGALYFDKREEKTLNIELEPNFGYITIKSEPSGADIFIDDTKVGTTPYQMKKIKLGQHVVELRKTGYESYADMVTIKTGEVNKQLENVRLMAEKVVLGKIAVTSTPVGSDISVDGEYKGQTPQTFDMRIGTHTVVVSKQGYSSVSKTVTVNESQTASVSVYLQNGREISISTDKEGDKIYVDGNYLGDSPLNASLTFGEHEVKAMRGEKESKKTITVAQNGGTTSVELAFFNSGNGGLIPVCGVNLGVTTTDELKRMGFEQSKYNPKCYDDETTGIDFWDHDEDGICESLYTTDSDRIPDNWKSAGLSWSMSYDEWMSFFRNNGYSIVVTKQPTIGKWDGRKTLSAEFKATAPDGNEFKLKFDYGNKNGEGYTVYSKKSLYNITVRHK